MPVTTYAVQARTQREGRLVSRAAAALPQTTTTDYFTIVGTVELISLVATVGTVIQTQADTLIWKWTPTGGSAVNLNTATDVTAVAAGGKIALMPLTDAGAVQSLTLTPVGGTGLALRYRPFVLTDGVISLTASASNTGTISCALRYRPFASNGRVAAA
jgi:hypothetical protein